MSATKITGASAILAIAKFEMSSSFIFISAGLPAPSIITISFLASIFE